MGQEQVNISGIDVSDLSGGLNSNNLSTLIEDRDATDAQNVYYYDGFLRKLFGHARANTQIGGFGATTVINGIHDFQLRDGTRYTVVVAGTSIYRRNGNTWTNITGALVLTNTRHQMITFNDTLIGTNFSDGPWVWTGTGNATILGGSPPRGRFITVFNGRVVLSDCQVGASRFPARSYYSAIDNGASWDTVDDYWEFETDDGQALTGALPLGQNLVAYKSDSIGLVSGYGVTTWQVDRQYRKGTGCISGYSLVHGRIKIDVNESTRIMREAHMFLGEDGFYAFDGSEVIRLSDKAKQFFKNFNIQRMPHAVAVYYKPLDQYWCYYTQSGDSQNSGAFIYDTQKAGIWPVDNINANVCAIVENSSTDLDEMLIGSNDSIVYQMNESNGGIEYTTELVTNGGMETDANWTSHNTPTTNDRSAVQTFNGSWARRAITDAVNEGFYQDITTVVDQNYRVTAAIYVTAGDCRLSKMDTDASDVVNSGTQSAASWALVSIDFTATATTSRIVFRSVAVAASTFFVDDCSVRRIDIDGFWDSKWFNMGDSQQVKILREVIPFAQTEGNYNVQIRVRDDFSTGSGTSSNFNLLESGGTYGTATYGTGVYGGQTQLFNDMDQIDQDAFRFLQVRFRNQSGNQPFAIERVIIDAKPIGRRFVHNAS